jgi:flagellar hook-associated protein 1 FlgK
MATILDIGTSALIAFQRSLNTTGHNIANSDTEGYSRQRTVLATRVPELTGPGYVGSGVKVVDIERQYDNFLSTQVRSTQSRTSELEVYYSHAARIDNILFDSNIGLNSSIQDFFDSINSVADDPSLIPTRQLLLTEAESMVDRFHDLSRLFVEGRDQLNQEMVTITDQINSLTESIALVNENIVNAIGASGGDSPNDLLDERDVLINHLSELVEISVVPQDDGSWNIFAGNGLTLVMGVNSFNLETQPMAEDASQIDITVTNFTGTQIVTNQLQGGQIGGLLKFRDQILDPGQNQLGLIAVGISDRLNSQHQLGVDLNGDFGGLFFSQPSVGIQENGLNTGTATVSASFIDTGNLTASDYELEATGIADQFTLTRLSDRQVTTINTGGAYPYTTAEIDGISVTISAGASVGDKFLIRPTRDAAEFLTLQINDVRKIAAAGPVRAEPTTNSVSGGANLGDGRISQPEVSSATNLPLTAPATITLEFDPNAGGAGVPGFFVTGGPGGTISYDPATQSTGANFTFAGYGGISFTITGTPVDGDRYVIENNSGAVGDNRNTLRMAELQIEDTLLGQTGGVDETASFQDVYSQLVSGIGSKTQQAEMDYASTETLLNRHTAELQAISGVNLDEEAANLVKYQQAYQAAAQVIAVANTLFDTLIGAVRR